MLTGSLVTDRGQFSWSLAGNGNASLIGCPITGTAKTHQVTVTVRRRASGQWVLNGQYWVPPECPEDRLWAATDLVEAFAAIVTPELLQKAVVESVRDEIWSCDREIKRMQEAIREQEQSRESWQKKLAELSTGETSCTHESVPDLDMGVEIIEP